MPPPHLLIFDCDGVLVDSETVANEVWVSLLAEHGLSFTHADFLRRSVGTTLVALYEGLQADYGWHRPRTFDEELSTRLARAFADVPPVGGAPELLSSLRVPFCVASNSQIDRLQLKLKAAGLAELVEGRVFHAGMVARGKPAPDLFLHAAHAMNAAPARCLVIEDSVLGTLAGVRAGMSVWGFTGGSHALPELASELRGAGAGEVFATMSDLGRALEGSGYFASIS